MAIEASHDETLGWDDRRWRAEPPQRETRERIDEAGYAGKNQRGADDAHELYAEKR